MRWLPVVFLVGLLATAALTALFLACKTVFGVDSTCPACVKQLDYSYSVRFAGS